MKNACQKIIFTGLQCKNYVPTRVDVQLLFILGLTKSSRSCKISTFNVSYSAVKSTAALIHHYHM